MLRIAVVGPGLMGRKHLELIHANPRSCVAAIVVPTHERHEATALAYSVPLYATVVEMLNDLNVDGVVISSPNAFHVEQGITCIEAGVPVLVEKPIADTYAAGRMLVDAAERTGTPVLVGHHRAHSPILRRAQDVIRSGRLGRIVAVSGSALFYKPPDYFDAGPWRREAGGGPILINLIHEIGNLRALCGEIAAIHGIGTSHTRGFPVEDTAALCIEFASGALATFLLSDTAASARSWEQTSGENPTYPTYDDEDCYEISGTLGSLAVPTMRVKYYRDPESASWWKPFLCETVDVLRDDPLTCQLTNFLNVIEGTEEPRVTGRDGLRNLQVVEALFASIRSGRRVAVAAE
jgi:predicted dehydrogenase